jgi:hypothetical protein
VCVGVYVAALVASMFGLRGVDSDLGGVLVIPLLFGISFGFGLATARMLAFAVPPAIAGGLAILWSTAEPWTEQSSGDEVTIAVVVGVLMSLGTGAGLAAASHLRDLDGEVS